MNKEYDYPRISDIKNGLFERNTEFNVKEQLPSHVQFNVDKRTTTIVENKQDRLNRGSIPEKKVTVVKKSEHDEPDYEKAFLMAYFIHYSGLSKQKAKQYLGDIWNQLSKDVNKYINKK